MGSNEYLFWGAITFVPLIVSGAVSVGIIKGKLHNFITFGKHADICHKKSEATNAMLTEIRGDIKGLLEGQGNITGYLEGLKDGKA